MENNNSYDEYPYESHPYSQTHPDRLAAVATLFAMRPVSIERCRVLELGCAGGGNLIPMALTLPASRFLGIDLSARQIGDGQKLVAALGLDNVELRHASILDVNQDYGLFDYIVCHGVYSWVPTVVQDKILEICARNLEPHGVAFVSYNTYPGWHMSGMIRDMLRYHARRFGNPRDRVQQARAMLKFLVEAAAHEQNAHSSLLREGLEVFGKVNNSYLLHEYLEEVNEPLYFHQFVERLADHELQYLAEAEVHAMMAGRFPPEVAATVEKLSSDFIELEQFLDFLRNRKFRQTLVCHRDVALKRNVGPEVLAELYVASALKPKMPDLEIGSTAPAQFTSSAGRASTTTEPVLKAALVHLAECWPQAVSFASLVGAARTRLGEAQNPAALASDFQILGKSVLQLYSANQVELHVRRLPFVQEIAEFPVASPLARLQAAVAAGVTNLRHEVVALSKLDRALLPLLDGKCTRAALVDHLADLTRRGAIAVEHEGRLVPSEENIRTALNAGLEQCLAGLANRALLATGTQ